MVEESKEEVVETNTLIKTTKVESDNSTDMTFIIGMSLFGLLLLVLASSGLYLLIKRRRRY
ncbi:hypothetical protein E1I69_22175 [Bacillus timonensis]|uniref:Uncharacterized protein n=1 Tax=Bacillus timonensis TaxID=1033734 RepID=A0A4S3PKI3_9BACI|nr:hypothetical protein E1I69_22175 [Bacillus timonensis]